MLMELMKKEIRYLQKILVVQRGDVMDVHKLCLHPNTQSDTTQVAVTQRFQSMMKPANGTYKASKVGSEDVIGNMPENVITHILDCLPIQDAVRTGILSTNWSYKWTMLTQLVFKEEFFKPGLQGSINCNEGTISNILLQLKGPILKFVLWIPSYMELNVEYVSCWVMFLSTKGIREFDIMSMYPTPLKLPSHLFSCLELRYLLLENCCFRMTPSFRGFPNLLKIRFFHVRFESGNIGEFITRCPLLEFLVFDPDCRIGKVKPIEIAKLTSLKTLQLPLCHFETMAITSSSIFQLVGCLPKLEMLVLNFFNCKIVVEGGGKKQVTNTFPCLKTLSLEFLNLSSPDMLSFALDMIWGFQNLQNLEINVTYRNPRPPPFFESSEVDFSRLRKLQLESVWIRCFRGSEPELHLIKCILACSPLLKKFDLFPHHSRVFGGERGKSRFATKLLQFYRSSPMVEISIFGL